MDEARVLAMLQQQLEAQLEELHDASEHQFTPLDNDPSVCAVCGWITLPTFYHLLFMR